MTTSITVAVWILATVATLYFLRSASQLLIPIVLGFIISYALEPIVAWLARHRVPRLAGTSLVLLALLALAAWGVYSLRDDVQKAIESLPETVRHAREMVMSTTGSGTAGSLQEAAGELKGGSQQSGGAASGGSGVGGLVQWGVGSVLALGGHLLVIFFLVFFLLLAGPHFRNRIVEIAGPDAERRKVTRQIIDDINKQIQRFLIVRLITAVVVGAATWIVLALMGVQNAAVWGILAGVFNSIPYFGPVIVSGGLLIVGLVQGGGMTQALQMSGAALVITSLEGWLLTPPLMGKAERMSALTVFLGVLLWTWVWGAWGTILAVPMLVVAKSVADHVTPLKPIGRLMAP
jgi:predicted PurR-regulated permease PerM